MVTPNYDNYLHWPYHQDEDPFWDRLPPGPDLPTEDNLEISDTLPNQDETGRVIPLPSNPTSPPHRPGNLEAPGLDTTELVMPLDRQADHLYPSEIDEIIDLQKLSEIDQLNYLRHYIADDQYEAYVADLAHGGIIFKHCIHHAGLTVKVRKGSPKPERMYALTIVDRMVVERADDEMPHPASKYLVTLKHSIWIQHSDPSLEWHAGFLTRSVEQLPPLKLLPFPEARLPDINHYFGITVIQLYADQHPHSEASRGRSAGGREHPHNEASGSGGRAAGGRDGRRSSVFEGGTDGIGRGSYMRRGDPFRLAMRASIFKAAAKMRRKQAKRRGRRRAAQRVMARDH
ncbi:hypothetical protein O6H91_18G004700 [Diphasiastrum complanatum]|uniref:Uncharacterized protein n=1 Tax=Diphasiastrum complanatum TaxID=34168 RepID=A0ACC2AXN6_DIPCM|nr:hypothetical protein O6H91_18G004700 [Diphasiastrum complanatum]